MEELSEDEEDGVWSVPEISEEEQPQPDEVKVTKRMAVTNLDWDAINCKDIFVLFTSFCASNKSHCVEKVDIYPSLFGIEQMKNDIMYGPPKEVFGDEKETRA